MKLVKNFKKIFPFSFAVHTYYLLSSLTISYVYFHKLIDPISLYDIKVGVLSVLNFNHWLPVQYRLFTAFVFKFLSYLLFFLSPNAILFIMMLVEIYLILLIFYLLLNKYFVNINVNAWLSPLILYPIFWDLMSMNSIFYYYDFVLILFILLGLYLIINDNKIWLLVLIFFATLNHDSILFIILAYFIYNVSEIKKPKNIFFLISYVMIYSIIIFTLQYIFRNNISGYYTSNKLEHIYFYSFTENIEHLHLIPWHIILRDILLNFGAMHLLIILLLKKTYLINIRHKMFYTLAIIIPIYITVVFYRATVDEMRNYAAVIPFVTILFLIYFSKTKNSFLYLNPELNRGS